MIPQKVQKQKTEDNNRKLEKSKSGDRDCIKCKYIKNFSWRGKCHASYKIKTTYCSHVYTSNIKIQINQSLETKKGK